MMWNRKSLTAPPVCELKVTLTQRNRDLLSKALKTLSRGKDVLREHDNLLKSEQYVMRRTVYKLANQFRREKSLCGVRQVLSCLRRIQDMQPSVMLENIREYVNINCTREEEQYLVSCQTMQYHLVRLQGLAALLQQTVNYCVYSFFHIRQHMEAGKMAPQNIVMLSGTARIWYVCRSLCDYVCSWYRIIHQCLHVFQSTPVVWLEESLPSNLKQWLVELFPEEKETDFSPNVIREHLTSTGAKTPESRSLQFATSLSLAGEDIGEPIKRQKDLTETEPASERTKTKKKGETKHNKMKLKRYMEMQNKNKNKSLDCSVQTLKLSLKKCIRTPEDLSKFKNQVKKKCIELNGCNLRISKLGKNKILKKIAMVTEKMHKEADACSEQMIIKKIRLPVSKLMLKYLENSVTDKQLEMISHSSASQTRLPVDSHSDSHSDFLHDGANKSNKKLQKVKRKKLDEKGEVKKSKVVKLKSKENTKKDSKKSKKKQKLKKVKCLK